MLGLLLAIDQSESVSAPATSTYRCLPNGQGGLCNRDKEMPITSHSKAQDFRSLLFDISAVLLCILWDWSFPFPSGCCIHVWRAQRPIHCLG